MWPQLARVKTVLNCWGRRSLMNPTSFGPVTVIQDSVFQEMQLLGNKEKHWFCGGRRSIAVAVNLLQADRIIAVPTDTIYGLAGVVSSNISLSMLYKIKERDENKPLAICVSSIKDIPEYAFVDAVLEKMFIDLLPGPVTVILKRKPSLNPHLNPGIDNVAIRVPEDKFIRNIARITGPLALTSANKSNTQSTLHPSEFVDLWPQLGGIFYKTPNSKILQDSRQREGSTIVDLTQSGYFKIIRRGMAPNFTTKICRRYALKPIWQEQN